MSPEVGGGGQSQAGETREPWQFLKHNTASSSLIFTQRVLAHQAGKRDSQQTQAEWSAKLDIGGRQGNRQGVTKHGPPGGAAGWRRPKDRGWRRTSWVSSSNPQRWGSPLALPCQSTGPEVGSRGSENGHTEPHRCHLEPPSEPAPRPCGQPGQHAPPGFLLTSCPVRLEPGLLPEACGQAPAPPSGCRGPSTARTWPNRA